MKDYFTLFYMTVTSPPSIDCWNFKNSLKKRAKVFVMNLNADLKKKLKILNKYYNRECIFSLFDGVASVVNVRFQVETCGIRFTIVTVEYNVAFCLYRCKYISMMPYLSICNLIMGISSET